MIKLSTNTTQTIRFIPRQGGINAITLTNETTGSVLSNDFGDATIYLDDEDIDYISSNSNTGTDNYYETMLYSVEGFLQEGQTYILKVYTDSGDLVFYDKVFCTDQTDYTINKDEFKSYSQSETYKTFKG